MDVRMRDEMELSLLLGPYLWDEGQQDAEQEYRCFSVLVEGDNIELRVEVVNSHELSFVAVIIYL